MADEKLELNNEQLNAAAGGAGASNEEQHLIYNSKGHAVGVYLSPTCITFYPCPKCVQPMYQKPDGEFCCDFDGTTARNVQQANFVSSEEYFELFAG